MGHYGKHIIDPETGLCEICDKNAIQEVRQGKRQPMYTNNNEIPYGQDRYETTGMVAGSYIRKSADSLPPIRRPMRPRRVIYEDTRREPYMNRRMIHRSTPHLPHQYTQTPPPPASDVWYAGTQRQINSGLGFAHRQPRYGPDEMYYHQTSPRNPISNHVRADTDSIYRPPVNLSMPMSSMYPTDRDRRPYRVEPMEQRMYNGPDPSAIQRGYENYPPARYEPPRFQPQITSQSSQNAPVYHIRSDVY